MTITDTQLADWVVKIGEKNELIAGLQAELEAVKSERDYLRTIITSAKLRALVESFGGAE